MRSVGKEDELSFLRRRLSRAEPESSGVRDLVKETFGLIVASTEGDASVEVLALLLVFLRFIKSTYTWASNNGQPETMLDEIMPQVASALRPNGTFVDMILSNLESPNKTCQNRATDALEAAAQLAIVVPPPSHSTSSSKNFLVPLLQQLADSDVSFRPTIRAICILVRYVPLVAVPPDLLDRLLRDIDLTDSASIRCGVIVKLLLNRETVIMPESENANTEMTYRRHLLAPLLPLFDQAAALSNLYRYLLPMLFKFQPSMTWSLLEALSVGPTSDSRFKSWVAVASLAVSAHVLDRSDLVESELQSAVQHQNFEIRLQAFTLLVSSDRLLGQDTVDMIKASMHCNRVLTSTGARSDFRSAFFSFLSRLRVAESLAKKTSKKLVVTADSGQANETTSNPILAVRLAADFHLWFLQDFVDSGLSHARQSPIAQAMTALSLLTVYLEVYRDDEEVSTRVFTLERVEALLACQASDFLEIRSRARNILAGSPAATSSGLLLDPQRGLLESAMESAKHPRRTQAEAGKAVLCIIFEMLVAQSAEGVEAVTFAEHLIDQLELHIQASEENLATAVEQYPLHGLIASLRDIIGCLRLTSPAAQDVWRPILSRSASMVTRVWSMTRRIICLAPSSPTGGAEYAEGPGHEISMAYNVLDAADCVDGVEGENEGDLDHINIVSGCWRATKDAADLLATITSLPIRQNPDSQTIWTYSEVEKAVQQFLEWFQSIRHRATFTKIALAFGRLMDVLAKNPRYSALCLSSLQHELDLITQDSVSTTRRSAALPYSILALVAGSQDLFDLAVTDLIGLAENDSHYSAASTRVHAFNILTIVLLDAKHTNSLDQHFEKAVMTAVKALESPNWSVRNVGLLFFSTLVHRSLAPPRGGQDYYQSRSIWATRHSLHSWHTRYPRVIPFISDYLCRSAAKTFSGVSPATAPSHHSPLFPILIICRSLNWSEQGQNLADDLCASVFPFLSSSDWQMREVAAQAISSLLSPAQALRHTLASRPNTLLQSRDLNGMHGQCLLLRLLITYTIDWDQTSADTHRSIGEILLQLLRNCETKISQPLITRIVVQTILALIENAPLTSRIFFAGAPDIWKLLRSHHSAMPGGDLLRLSCAELLIGLDNSLSTLVNLLSSSEDCKILALERLIKSGQSIGTGISEVVLEMATSTANGDETRTAALLTIDKLSQTPSTAFQFPGAMMSVTDSLKDILNDQKSVPLTEAALPALGLSISQNPSFNSGDHAILAVHLLRSSDENESQPARYSALLSLAHLKRQIFTMPNDQTQREALLPMHQVFHRLLEDDDQDVREKAIGILVNGLGLPRPVVQVKAVELWWQWLLSLLKTHLCGTAWLEWVWDLCIDSTGFDHDIAVLDTSGYIKSGVLFEVEPPNLFRDPLVDVAHASRLLAALDKSDQGKRQLERKHVQATQALSRMGPLSPIEEAFEARRRLVERMSLQRPVFERIKERPGDGQ